jgi:cell division inhibitor SulA
MPKFLIERELPGAGALTPSQLREIARKSVQVLRGMGPAIQWVQTYVGGDALYCVYLAPDEAAVREHARQGGFPVTRVTQLAGTFDPTTAEA